MAKQGIKALCEVLLRTGCIKFGTFKLSSGALSPYYVDLRLIPSDPEAFKRVIGLYSEVLEGSVIKRADRLAGIPTAGLPYASVLAFNLSKPLIYVRKETKEHGGHRRIEGAILPGDKVLILDDVVTTGMNLVDAVDAIRSEGGVVEEAVVLLDRQQGGEPSLKKIGVHLRSYATITRVAETLMRHGTIDETQYGEILKQITD